MYYNDPDMMIDEYIINKHEKDEEMLTVNYKSSDNNNVNNNNNNNNEVNEMSENKKVAVVFVSAKGKMSKPMMAVEDVAAACKDMDWRDIYAKEDYAKACIKRGLRIARGKTIKNPSHVKELGVASGKLQPLAAYKVLMRKVRLLDKTYIQKAVDCFKNATIKYYDEVKKRPITHNEAMAMAKNKVQDAKTIIEVKVDKPVVDKPVSLFNLDGLDDGLGDIASLPKIDIEVENKKRELTEERNALQTLVEQTIEITQKSHKLLSDLLAKRGDIEVQLYDLERNEK